jgi:hypothetical protein
MDLLVPWLAVVPHGPIYTVILLKVCAVMVASLSQENAGLFSSLLSFGTVYMTALAYALCIASAYTGAASAGSARWRLHSFVFTGDFVRHDACSVWLTTHLRAGSHRLHHKSS